MQIEMDMEIPTRRESPLRRVTINQIDGLSETCLTIIHMLSAQYPNGVTNYTIGSPMIGGLSHTRRISDIREWIEKNDIDMQILCRDPGVKLKKSLRVYHIAYKDETLEDLGKEIRGEY